MLGLVDIIFAMVVFISVMFALYRGLVRELLGIAAWILAGFAALYSYAPLMPLMNKMIDNKTTAGIVGSLIVALTVLIIMTLINSAIAKRLRRSALSGLDRILGFLFGVARAGLLAAVCYLGASMFLSTHQLNELETQNLSIPYIRVMAGWVEYVIPNTVKDDIKAYEQGKLKEGEKPKVGIVLKPAVQEGLSDVRTNSLHWLKIT